MQAVAEDEGGEEGADGGDEELGGRCGEEPLDESFLSAGLTPLMFQALMLSSSNRAVSDVLSEEAAGDLDYPIHDYWVASSHNTYLMDRDQLAGHSSSAVYGRLLLQGCRSVELDCWDGPDGEPIITHGFTLCSSVSFASVVEAIASCAFVTSPLPVSLSLEMHCSRQQQTRIAELLHYHLDDLLLLPEEAEALACLSPVRVPTKGKPPRPPYRSAHAHSHQPNVPSNIPPCRPRSPTRSLSRERSRRERIRPTPRPGWSSQPRSQPRRSRTRATAVARPGEARSLAG